MAEALRDIYGKCIARIAEKNDKVVILDADLSNCSKTCYANDAVPERMFNVGIAEANMITMGAGFASCGFVPFVNTFATLAASMCSLSMKALISYSDLNVKLVGVNNGLCGGYDGSTHHALDDISMMRAIPNLLIACPSDAVMTEWMVDELANKHSGPAYVSMSRNGYAPIYSPDEEFEFGKAKCVKDGTDVSIFACGLAVTRALTAANKLEAEGITARVYDMFTIKPLDEEAVMAAVKETGAIVTVDEHSVIGGLGSAVVETVALAGAAIPIEKVGIKDCFTESGKYEDLIKKYGIGADDIIRAVYRVMERK